MLRTKSRKKLKRNPDSKDEKDRKRQIDEFVALKGIKRLEPGKSYLRTPISTLLKQRTDRCQLCDSWIDDSGELRHYDWCPTYKKSRKNPTKRLSRKNPVTTKKSSKRYSDLIEFDRKKSSRNNIFLNYQGKEIEFTGKDAEDLRDILKYQLKLFRDSSRLQTLYPRHLDDAGGFDTYITEQLQKVYPEVFR